MTPLETVKEYANLILAVLTLLVACYFVWWMYHAGYEHGLEERDKVQAAWDADKAERAKAAALQAAESAAKEAAQQAITKQKEMEYAKVKSERDAALAKFGSYKLCPAEVVPRNENVPVARGGEAAMPGPTKGTTGTAELSALAAGFTFEAAVKDRDQCNALIDWVKAQGM